MSGHVGCRVVALTGFAAAVLLCACGGGASGPESTSTRPTGKAAEHKASRPQELSSHSKSHDEAQTKQGDTRDRVASGGGSTSRGRGVKGCVNGVSKRLCAQVAAIRKQHDDKPPPQETETDKCRDVMNRSTCKAVTRAHDEAQGSEPAPEPGKCPPTLNATQCADLAKAYTKATK